MDVSNIVEYIKPELLILIPVLYLLGLGIKKSAVPDNLIPLILGGVGIVLSAVYLFSVVPVPSVATVVFTAVTQGILCAGASVYIDQLIKQAKKGK